MGIHVRVLIATLVRNFFILVQSESEATEKVMEKVKTLGGLKTEELPNPRQDLSKNWSMLRVSIGKDFQVAYFVDLIEESTALDWVGSLISRLRGVEMSNEPAYPVETTEIPIG